MWLLPFVYMAAKYAVWLRRLCTLHSTWLHGCIVFRETVWVTRVMTRPAMLDFSADSQLSTVTMLLTVYQQLELPDARSCRGGHRHLQIGRMLDIDLISEPPPPPQMYVSKVWESVWPEGAGSDS
jgi:hypothetical protein